MAQQQPKSHTFSSALSLSEFKSANKAPTTTMPRRTGGGRIRVHERTVGNSGEIIDAGVDIAEEHSKEISETDAP